MIEIRPFKERDVEEIYKVEELSFGDGAYSHRMIKLMLHIPESFTLVLSLDSRIAGYATAIREDNESVDIESIAIIPEMQHGGYGSLLIEAIELEALKRGYHKIILEVREKNINAIEFYKKHKYSEVEFLANYYHLSYKGSKNAYRMIKKID